MQPVNKFTQFIIAVRDIPKAKAFYANKLGLRVTTDYRQDDDHWWVNLERLFGPSMEIGCGQ